MAKETNNKDKKKDNKNFFKEFKAELKRVSWPTFKQVVNNTLEVIAIVVLIAVIVFVLDVVFENLNKFGVEKLKAIVTSSSEEATEEGDNTSSEAEVIDAESIDTVDGTESTEGTTDTVEENSEGTEANADATASSETT